MGCVVEVQAVFDALKPYVHLRLHSFPTQIIASHAVNVFTHPEKLGDNV